MFFKYFYFYILYLKVLKVSVLVITVFFSERTSFFRYLFINRHFSEPVGHMFYNDSENSPADCMVFLIFQAGRIRRLYWIAIWFRLYRRL